MPTSHTVQQGENLAKIAKQYGFKSHNTIWDDPSNEELRRNRLSPNILYPGDVINIPDKTSYKIKLPTNKVHTLVVRSPPPQKLRIKVLDQDGVNWQGIRATLVVGEESIDTVLTENGFIELYLPEDHEDTGTLELYLDEDSEQPSHSFTLNLSHLDPADQVTGMQSRLNSLGYLCGNADGEEGPKTNHAVKEFQLANDLEVTGKLDVATELKLQQKYGC